MSSEIYSFVFEKLFNLNALDVYCESIFMKKNRPAYKLNVICDEKDLDNICEFILEETSTIGLRYYKIKRKILERKIIKFKTKYGNVSVKMIYKDKKLLRYTPEYEECKEISTNFNIPLMEVYDEIKYKVKDFYRQFSKKK